MKTATYYRAEISHKKYRNERWTIDVVARNIPEAISKLAKILPPLIRKDTGEQGLPPYQIDGITDKGIIYL